MTQKRLQKIRAMLMASCMIVGMGGAAADITAPVLSSPTGVSAASTTATVGATTDSSDGTLYTVVSTVATAPTSTQIIAGHDSTNGVPTNGFTGSVAVVSTGVKTINATGLTAGLTYYAHSVHKDAAGNIGNVVTSTLFATYYAAEDLVYGVTPPVTGSSAIGGGGTFVISGRPIGRSGQITKLRVWGHGAATIKFKRFTRSGLVWTMVSEQSLVIAAGLNTFTSAGATMAAVNVNAGDYVGFYFVGADIHYSDLGSNILTGTEYTYDGSDVTTTFNTGAATAPSGGGIQLQVEWTVTSAAIAASTTYGSVKYLGEPSIAAGTGAEDTTATFYEDTIFPVACRLETIQAYASATGGGLMVFILNGAAAGYSLNRAFTINLSNGNNTYTAGTDFPRDVVIPALGRVGYWSLNATLQKDNGSTRPGLGIDASVSTSIYPGLTAFNTFDNIDVSIGPQIKLGYKLQAPLNLPTDIVDFTFASVIHFDFASTNWSIVSGKARNSSTGIGSPLYYRYGGPFAGTVSAWITFTGATDKVYVGRRGLSGEGGFATVASIDMNGHVIGICDQWDQTPLPSITSSKTSTITFITGREYKIDLTNTNDNLTVTVTDTVTLATDSYSVVVFNGTHATNYGSGRGYGSPCVFPITGTIDVSRIKFTPLIRQPEVVCIGDSLTDGSGATAFSTTWPSVIAASRSDGSVLAVAVGGSGVGSFINDLHFVGHWFNPEHIIMLGSHNNLAGGTSAWQALVAIFKVYADLVCSDVWFGALLPEPLDDTIEVTWNPWLRSTYPGRILDFDKCITNGRTGLGADRKEQFFSSTADIHPMDGGYALMGAEAIANAPAIIT